MKGLEQLRKELAERGYGQRLLVDEPLSRHTSFAIGGPADLLLSAREPGELRELVELARANRVSVLVIGGGTNILVADKGVRGLVIVNECRGHAVNQDGMLVAQSGALTSRLARKTCAHAWAGLAWAADIPGTVGGAVVGNAGAYGGCMADVVRWVTLMQADGAVGRVGADWLDYGYRASALKACQHEHRPIVLEVGIQLRPGDAEELARKVEQIVGQRRVQTPEGHCAGSVFKRTLQYPAGFLIEQAGLKGKRIGGAEISEKHANYVMNTGGATAADVRALIELVQGKVLADFGERLEIEIEFVGEWS